MDLQVLGSSSKGNCYILSTENESLIIEAGIRLAEVKQALDFNISKIVGCIITHEHGDHSKYAQQYLAASIPIYASKGTIDGMHLKTKANECRHSEAFQLGSFQIMPFDVQHDCNQPFGYLIKHPDMGKMLFLTDTFYSDFTFKGLNHILVEANYCDQILKENIKSGKISRFQEKRLRFSHMSLNTCKNMLRENDLSNCRNIVLLHLSDRNSNADRFHTEVTAQTGIPTYIADKGLTIKLTEKGY